MVTYRALVALTTQLMLGACDSFAKPASACCVGHPFAQVQRLFLPQSELMS